MLFRWFDSYVSMQEQLVSLSETNSNYRLINIGVALQMSSNKQEEATLRKIIHYNIKPLEPVKVIIIQI